MTDFVRRLVSGNKARFKDGELNLELDLVYVTDQVIIMGYPAAGIEGLYRNRREDARKFLDHRHGKNYWIFNFCPIKENSYPATFFKGRVSRYPFPDHHAPPLALLPLAAREICTWLSGFPERVAVLHCKAGKGRSGTLACSYLLSLDDAPSPPRLERNYTSKQWAKVRTEEWIQVMPEDDTSEDIASSKLGTLTDTDQIPQSSPENEHSSNSQSESTDTKTSKKPFADTLKDVLELHTSRRMKPAESPAKKPNQGVSIPSQRRWLNYWSLLLAREAPSDFWSLTIKRPKVRLTQIKLRMKEASGVKINLFKAANMVLDRTNLAKSGGLQSNGHVWVSLARYSDELVEKLERWERHTRHSDGKMGIRAKSSGRLGDEDLSEVFADGKWDKGKMVRSFARLGIVKGYPTVKENDGSVLNYTLRPLTGEGWNDIREELQEGNPENVLSATNSVYDITQPATGEGIILDAGREVRAKLYMGQVFMGWFWFIPTFHMSRNASKEPTKLTFTKKEMDFPLGIGSDIVDTEISLEWCPETEDVQPPARQTSADSAAEGTGEPADIAATIQAMTTDLDDAVHLKQAAED